MTGTASPTAERRLQEFEERASSLAARRAELEQSRAAEDSRRADALAAGDLDGSRAAAVTIREVEQALADVAEDTALVQSWAEGARAELAQAAAMQRFERDTELLKEAERAAAVKLAAVAPAVLAAIDAGEAAVVAYAAAAALHGELIVAADALRRPRPDGARSPAMVAMQEAFTVDEMTRQGLLMARTYRHVALP